MALARSDQRNHPRLPGDTRGRPPPGSWKTASTDGLMEVTIRADDEEVVAALKETVRALKQVQHVLAMLYSIVSEVNKHLK
jgi:hypothetical protein